MAEASKPEKKTWRSLLASLLVDPQRQQQLADQIGVSPVTIKRWITGSSTPNIRTIRRLLQALPQHRNELHELFIEDHIHLTPFDGEEASLTIDDHIPPEFYAQVIQSYTDLPDQMRVWSLNTLILQQLLGQLETEEGSLIAIIFSCMPPTHSVGIRSLRWKFGLGTGRWQGDITYTITLIGAESLSGYALTVGRSAFVRNIATEPGLLPTIPLEGLSSAIAVPLRRLGQIAGSLYLGSTVPDFFHDNRVPLIEAYSDLVALAFEPHEFFDHAQLSLQILPPQEAQARLMTTFRSRVMAIMRAAAQEQLPCTLREAEERVWREIEEELLNMHFSI